MHLSHGGEVSKEVNSTEMLHYLLVGAEMPQLRFKITGGKVIVGTDGIARPFFNISMTSPQQMGDQMQYTSRIAQIEKLSEAELVAKIKSTYLKQMPDSSDQSGQSS